MFSFVRGSNPGACTNTWETCQTHEKKREIHEKNVKFMKKNMKFMKKKREIHEQT